MAGRYQRFQFPALSPRDKEDRFACGIEGEQHPDLAATGRGRSQFLRIVKLAALYPIDQGPSEARALFDELVDGVGDPICGDRVGPAEAEEPGLCLRMEAPPKSRFQHNLFIMSGAGAAAGGHRPAH
jgi:hypothetical protein